MLHVITPCFLGIAKSNGVIRDFAGSYFVSEDNMGFGNPTRYLQLNPNLLTNTEDQPADVWDKAVETASNVYVTKVHNLCCDNCHSHVAMALNLMKYNDSWNWNMIKLAFWMFFCGKYVGFSGILKTWMPFLVCIGILLVLILFL